MNNSDEDKHMNINCSNCIYHISLHKHPWNKGDLRGSILEESGLYACILDYFMNKKNIGIIADRVGNGCEMHTPKNEGEVLLSATPKVID